MLVLMNLSLKHLITLDPVLTPFSTHRELHAGIEVYVPVSIWACATGAQ